MTDKKQQEVLDSFFKELFTWDMSNLGFWIVTGIADAVLGILMFCPREEMLEMKGLAFGMSIWGAGWYVMAYLQIKDNGKQCKVYEKLKYLPVSLQQIRLFRLRKLIIFSSKITLVFMAAKLLSLFFTRDIGLLNIFSPVFYGFVIPVVLVGGITWFSK